MSSFIPFSLILSWWTIPLTCHKCLEVGHPGAEEDGEREESGERDYDRQQ